jgi:hypothetical protein
VLDKLRVFAGQSVDGHVPGLTGPDLQASVAAGISSDHESVTAEEACEKLRLGMTVFLREVSNARNLVDLLLAVDEYTSQGNPLRTRLRTLQTAPATVPRLPPSPADTWKSSGLRRRRAGASRLSSSTSNSSTLSTPSFLASRPTPPSAWRNAKPQSARSQPPTECFYSTKGALSEARLRVPSDDSAHDR